MICTATTWELLEKVFESDNAEESEHIWEAGFIPRKKAIWKRMPEYFWKEGGASVAASMCLIGLKWKRNEEKLGLHTH